MTGFSTRELSLPDYGIQLSSLDIPSGDDDDFVGQRSVLKMARSEVNKLSSALLGDEIEFNVLLVLGDKTDTRRCWWRMTLINFDVYDATLTEVMIVGTIKTCTTFAE